jgi:hypothetical protein
VPRLVPTNPTATSNAAGTATFNVSTSGFGSWLNLRATAQSAGFSDAQGNSTQFSIQPVGGPGGVAFQFFCPEGSVGTGIRGRAGDDIDYLQFHCKPRSEIGSATGYVPAGQVGNPDAATPWDNSCTVGATFTGIHGLAGPTTEGNIVIVDTLGSFCSDGARFGAAGEVTPGTARFELVCPTGQSVVGIRGGFGALLDRLAIVCQ